MQNRRSSFEYEDLLACGRGEMFPGGPQLPLPPMLMFDRISEIADARAANTARASSAPNSTSSRTSGSSRATSRAIR